MGSEESPRAYSAADTTEAGTAASGGQSITMENQSPNGNAAPVSLDSSALTAGSAAGHLSNGSAAGSSPNPDHHHQQHLRPPSELNQDHIQQQAQQNKRDVAVASTNNSSGSAVSVITNSSHASVFGNSYGLQQLDNSSQSLDQQVNNVQKTVQFDFYP